MFWDFEGEIIVSKLQNVQMLVFEISLLGHVIWKDGISFDIPKVEAMIYWARPTNVTELMATVADRPYFHHGKANVISNAWVVSPPVT